MIMNGLNSCGIVDLGDSLLDLLPDKWFSVHILLYGLLGALFEGLQKVCHNAEQFVDRINSGHLLGLCVELRESVRAIEGVHVMIASQPAMLEIWLRGFHEIRNDCQKLQVSIMTMPG